MEKYQPVLTANRSNKEKRAKRVNVVSLKLVRESSFLYPKREVNGPTDAAEAVKDFLVDADREKFVVLCLDTKNQPTAISVVSIGSLNSTLVHPREIFKTAILSNSAAVILAHNHPSGNPTPSPEDIAVTKRLREAGTVVGIEVLDHVIIGEGGSYQSIRTIGAWS